MCARAGVAHDVSTLTGVAGGCAFDGPTDARSILEPLASAHGFVCTERDGQLVFRMPDDDVAEFSAGRLIEQDNGVIEVTRAGLDAALPSVRIR